MNLALRSSIQLLPCSAWLSSQGTAFPQPCSHLVDESHHHIGAQASLPGSSRVEFCSHLKKIPSSSPQNKIWRSHHVPIGTAQLHNVHSGGGRPRALLRFLLIFCMKKYFFLTLMVFISSHLMSEAPLSSQHSCFHYWKKAFQSVTP